MGGESVSARGRECESELELELVTGRKSERAEMRAGDRKRRWARLALLVTVH